MPTTTRKRTESESDAVLAPGGSILRNRVTQVQPEKVLQFDRLGNPVLIPRKQLPSRPELREQMVAKGFALTPGGYRPSSLVQRIEQGQALHLGPITGDGTGEPRIVELTTNNVIKKIAQPSLQPSELPALGSGWITYAYWNNGTGHPISDFKTTWRVPPPPESKQNQTIFLFNGIQNYGANFGILQPVLQWGPSAAGGGQYWAVASWYVTSNGYAFHSPLVPVNPGDTLIGAMKMTGRSGQLFNYSCLFEGLNPTQLQVFGIAELLWCNETLEAYSIESFSDYPAAYNTPLRDINLLTGNGTPSVNWTPIDAVTDCGQHTIIVNNSSVNGEVDLYYRFKEILNDTAINAPGAVEFGNRLVVAWAGTDPEHHLNIIQSPEEDVWFDKLTLNDTSPAGATLCVFHNRLYLAWSGSGNQQLNVMSSANGIYWEQKVVLNETSVGRPALTVYRDQLVLGWVGSDLQRHLNVLFSGDGVNWHSKRTLGEEGIDAPALAAFNDRLFIAWTGTNHERNLNIMSSSDQGESWQNKVILPETSVAGPSLFVYSNQLYLSWSGTDINHSLNTILTNDGVHFTDKVTLWDSSDYTPILSTCYDGDMGVVWTGRDAFHHLNLMTL
ncbi:hypothetical protein [Puia dinghuensis]|uniref:Uncharacterized protein n=1 Tax=Puia dinghuensis TaxID=1792502 RepID=A0A8J2UCX8_9BACT|nr:hypothetical protein [Puia dinghuensis]GGB00609.1 hypothetical protein GCM10011511_24870 [Puia dinghuensis]